MNSHSSSWSRLIPACFAAAFSTAAPAGTINIPLNGRQSVDALGDPSNVVVIAALPPHARVTQVGWTSATLETGPGNTWGSHARIRLSDPAQSSPVDLVIFDGGDFPNLWGPETRRAQPIGAFPGSNGPEVFGSEFLVDAAGTLRVEFYESVDNNPNALDSIWIAGSLVVGFEIPCFADIAPAGSPPGDGVVDVDDLLAVINAWGACANPNDCPADIAPIADGNEAVDVDDLLAVINGWGACP